MTIEGSTVTITLDEKAKSDLTERIKAAAIEYKPLVFCIESFWSEELKQAAKDFCKNCRAEWVETRPLLPKK